MSSDCRRVFCPQAQQAVHQRSLINHEPELVYQITRAALESAQRAQGNEDALGRSDKEGSRKDVHMAVCEGGGQRGWATSGGAPVECPVSQKTPEEPNSLCPGTCQEKPLEV